MLSKPKAWGAFINLSGISKIYLLQYDSELDSYWTTQGPLKANFSFPAKLGLHCDGRCVKFTSAKKEEVKLWLSGAKALRKVIQGILS